METHVRFTINSEKTKEVDSCAFPGCKIPPTLFVLKTRHQSVSKLVDLLSIDSVCNVFHIKSDQYPALACRKRAPYVCPILAPVPYDRSYRCAFHHWKTKTATGQNQRSEPVRNATELVWSRKGDFEDGRMPFDERDLFKVWEELLESTRLQVLASRGGGTG